MSGVAEHRRCHRDSLAPEHARELDEVARLAAGAGADVGAIQFDVAHLLRLLSLAGSGWHATVGSSLSRFTTSSYTNFWSLVGLHGIVALLRAVEAGAGIHVFCRARVEGEDGILAPASMAMLAMVMRSVHREVRHAGAVELHRAIRPPSKRSRRCNAG